MDICVTCVHLHLYRVKDHVLSAVDGVLIVTVLECTPSSVAYRSIFLAIWSDYLDYVLTVRGHHVHRLDGVSIIIPIFPGQPIPRESST